MSSRSSAYYDSLIERLEKKQSQLEKIRDLIDAELDIPVEEYRFNSGEGGNQWARRRSLRQLKEYESKLESEIDQLNRRLRRGGITNIVLRRR